MLWIAAMLQRSGWNFIADMDEEQFSQLVNLYDRFANALDFESPDATEAESGFFALLHELFEQEKRQTESIQFDEFKRALIVRCKRRIATGG